MAESTKLRLVRCPKCENLLPELADYSVYQCGGCGAVLRAKTKLRDTDTFSEKSDRERLAAVATESKNSSEKEIAELSDASDADVKSNAGSLRPDEKIPEISDLGNAEEKGNQSKANSGEWVIENGLDVNGSGNDLGIAVGRENGDLNSRTGSGSESQRSGRMSGLQHGETGEIEDSQGIMRTEVQGVRFSTSNHPDEGPSNYNFESSYSYRELFRDQDDHEGDDRVPYLEQDRAELLRKLDELREQLSRSQDAADKSKDKVPLNGRMAPHDTYGGLNTWFPGSSSVSDRAAKQFSTPDKHAAGPPHFNLHPEPFPYSSGNEMHRHRVHPPVHNSNHTLGYGDHLGSQMFRRGSHQLPSQYPQPPRQYFSGHYFDTSADAFEPYPSNVSLNQPSCSCLHCYDKHHGISAPVPPTSFSKKRYPDVSNSHILYQHEDPGPFGSHLHNSSATVPPFNFRSTKSHTRWASDLNSEMGGFLHSRPRRVVLASGARCCRPIVGGAPFLTCFNCFELLELPKKTPLVEKKQNKLQCGTCSTVISFAVVNKKLVLSANAETKHIPTEVEDSSNELMKENTSDSHGHLNRINHNFSSEDYDNSGYDFQTIDTDHIGMLTDNSVNSTKPHEMRSFHSSSLTTSEDETSPEVLIAPREVLNSVQQPVKASLSPPPAGSPLKQHFDYSSNNQVANRFGKGNRSSRSDQEKVITNKATTRQNSMKETSMATEMEVSFHEYSNIGISQDSGDGNREDAQPKTNKGGESFLTNFIKKSFKDLSRTDDRGRGTVYINGNLIPERLVKKAEKQAGPIQPGQYWYDYRAGFWGIMGGPCLGIVPPFIEDFNFSMPEKCAGGNTGVFVNGRELHQKDLDLLATRGLPTERDGSYIIEISGRVLDEDTGEELDSLGKLAPTVEKVKRGFGMKPPKAAAQ